MPARVRLGANLLGSVAVAATFLWSVRSGAITSGDPQYLLSQRLETCLAPSLGDDGRRGTVVTTRIEDSELVVALEVPQGARLIATDLARLHNDCDHAVEFSVEVAPSAIAEGPPLAVTVLMESDTGAATVPGDEGTWVQVLQYSPAAGFVEHPVSLRLVPGEQRRVAMVVDAAPTASENVLVIPLVITGETPASTTP